jgi:phosphohistidine phosphatase SixA
LKELGPEIAPAKVLAALSARHIDEGHVLLVSHMPLVGALVAHLTDGPAEGFAAGTLVRISCPYGAVAGCGHLTASFRPEDDVRL